MSKQKRCADELVSGLMENEQLDPEDQNPFSFREFLRWKNQDHPDQDHLDQDHLDQDHLDQLQSAAEEEDEGGQEVRVTFDLKEEGWGRSLQAGVRAKEEEEEQTRFSSRHEDQQGGGGGAEGGGRGGAEAAGGGGKGENEEGHEENFSCRRIQIHQVQQDNVSLRKSIEELQSRSDANELRVQQLSEELVQRRSQDHKENQDLESLVQSVEQNLRLMTRALKAEASVSKLKVALQQLQSENDRLKAADSEIVMTMRHNAQVASEYLNKTASHAHSSISQLLGEAETLRLVSQLLKSIDKISNLDTES
ncbi:endosome-associated-trafficking regulator 1 isoform X2 [Clinocottus analis]|uniref:endosome-associated-trafficking regulator 1 isoform X2 n=1 Tax=Clinocottus analis TaxID=304258 RepID=UPI0035C167EA